MALRAGGLGVKYFCKECFHTKIAKDAKAPPFVFLQEFPFNVIPSTAGISAAL
jgi:hypothetical protein